MFLACFERNLNGFIPARRKILSNKIGPDGKLTVPPVDQDSQLNPGWTTKIHQEIHRRSDRPARKEDIVHQNDPFQVDRLRKGAFFQERGRRLGRKVVPIESDVHRAKRHGGTFDRADDGSQTFCQDSPAFQDPDQIEIPDPLISLENFMGHAANHPVNLGRVQENPGQRRRSRIGRIGILHGNKPFPGSQSWN